MAQRSTLAALLLSCTPLASLHAQDGFLDPSFSGDGKVIYDSGGQEEQGVDIAVRPDGKIWVIANSYDGVADTERILLMRFNSDGTPDNTFFGDGTQELSEGAGYTFSTCAVLQADGSLLIGGYYIDELGYTAPMVIKVDANGNPLPGFGTSGFALGTAEGYRVTDMGVQSTGTIVVTLGPLAEISPAVCAISSAGGFGTYQTQLQCSLHDKLTALQVQADDRVLVTGYSGIDNGLNWRALILALNPDLTGDLTFSLGYVCGVLALLTEGVEYYDSGNPLIYTNDTGNDIAVLANGNIMVVGTTIDTTGNGDVYRTSMLKVHADNSVDASFGLEGWRKPYVGSFLRRMVVQANDNVLAVGGDYDGELVLARFNTNGVLDAGFGNNAGFTNTAVGSFSTNPSNLAVQADGRILVVGTAVNNNDDVLVLRYNGGASGINEQSYGAEDLRIFPDPTDGAFTVTLPPDARRLSITDAAGHLVLQRSVRALRSLDLRLQEAGSYTLIVEGAAGRAMRRIAVL